ncbi:MAG: hypothetical protein M0Z31_11425 [Clostridia bacterium]|nr:hypothetical protein [Clostridia bacterium]
MARKKQGFWILVVFFGILAVLGVFKAQVDGPQMAAHDVSMGTTMGSMMKQEYGSHLTVAELLKAPENAAAVAAMAQNHTPPPVITFISELTTAGIYVLLPFIFGGVAVLLVLWR